MPRSDKITAQFVSEIPDRLEMQEGILYISVLFNTANHLCACGCGRETVTPISSTGWKLSFDGRVSLSPSIGNFRFPCRSHYWIASDAIQWVTGDA